MTGLMSCCRFDAGKSEAQGGQVQEGGLLVSVSVDGWDGPGDPGETLVLRLVCFQNCSRTPRHIDLICLCISVLNIR